jgi:hypothetical protein
VAIKLFFSSPEYHLMATKWFQRWIARDHLVTIKCFFPFTLKPPGGHKVGFFFVWRLDGHHVVSTLNYEGPLNGHQMCFFFLLGNHLVVTKWF